MNGESLNIQQDQLEKLKQLFPEAITEGKIDWEKLQATLGKENIEFRNERYVLNWAGKTDAFKVLQQSTTATLKPAPDESINFETTENVFIEGENLEVLKVLQKAYYGKVKCIIIDPPYNTGNDSFIYPDSFKESKEDYQKRIGEKDEDGYLMKEGFFRKNSKDSGHYHSNWLSMMYPRLFLAKNLLRDDGVIFIFIGQTEISNLISLCNEIYGEENKIGIITRLMKTGGNKGKYFSPNTEYIIVYAKNIENVKEFRLPLEQDYIDKIYNQVENNELKKGERYRVMGLYQAGLDERANQRYWIKCPDNTFVIPPGKAIPEKIKEGEKIKPYKGDGVWRWIFERFNEELKNNNIIFKKTKTSSLLDENGNKSNWNIYTKIWLNDRLEEGRVPTDIIDNIENRLSSQELKDLDIPFDFAKPQRLISYLIQLMSVEKNDIIMDFFGGSCSTAHAILELNKEDVGNRKFILVQLPEKCDEESEAYKAGYKTISDIAKERIRRVIKKIEKEKQENKNLLSDIEENKSFDLGFKVFKLSSSSFKIWRGNEITEENLETQLDAFTNPVKEESKTDNMLYELILKAGYLLTDKVEAKGNYYLVNDGELIIALEEMNQKLIAQIISAKPKKVIMLDKLFTGNDQLKTNTVLQMRDAEIDFKTI